MFCLQVIWLHAASPMQRLLTWTSLRGCISTFRLFFCLHETLMSYVLRKAVSLHKPNQLSKIRQCYHECIFFFSLLFIFPKPLSPCIWAMNTRHQGEYFYLHFRMSNSKQLGVRNCSAPVIPSR